MTELNGKVAVVIGAGNAIAAGIAARLAREGAQLLLADADAGALSKALQGLGFETDAAVEQLAGHDPASVTAAVSAATAAFGRIDMLVNMSSNTVRKVAVAQADGACLYATLDRGAASALAAMQAALPNLRERGGSILNVVASEAERLAPSNLFARTTAEALKALSQTAAYEWGGYGVRVNMLVALADTPELSAHRDADAEAFDFAMRMQAIPRLGGLSDDIGGAALYLLSDDSRYVTGQVVYADGGQFLAPALIEPKFED